MITDEQSKAVQELAKTANAAMPIAQGFASFLGKVLGRPVEVSAGMLTDYITTVRAERQLRLAARYKEALARYGVSEPNKALPLNIGLEAVRIATLEENDLLQDMWAQLLANGTSSVSGIELQKSFISILEELTPLDAKVLRAITECPEEFKKYGFVMTAKLPDNHFMYPDKEKLGEADYPSGDLLISLSNLVRLGCITPVGTLNGIAYWSAMATPIGEALIRAVSAK